MNNILNKIKDIKNIKIDKTLLLYIFILIPFFKPPIINIMNIVIMKDIYNILFILSWILILIMVIRKKDVSKFSILTLIYIAFLSITTFINKGIDMSFIKTMCTIFMTTLLIHYGTKYNCQHFLKAIIIITSILIWINFITIIMYPNGMYYNEISHLSYNYFLGIDNIHIIYFLCFWISSIVYINIYNKKPKFCSLTIFISILSVIMRWSATTLVGTFIIGIYLLFFDYFSKIKLLNIKTFVITYVVGYFGIICFKLQNLFSFIIVKILKKDLTFTRRTRIWDMTIKSIKESPIIGHGLVGYDTRNLTTGISHAHNFFLEILYQGGFILLAISLLLIGSVLKKLNEYYNHSLAKKLSVCILALFVMMLMEFYAIEYIIFILALCYAIENYVIEIKNQKSKLPIVDNEVVIIGKNHHNTLGVIRSLGEKGIHPNVIITNEDKYAYVAKSKYVSDYDIVKEDEDKIKEILIKKYANLENKAILIPTSDFAALFLDNHFDELKSNFILPNINNKQGEIEKLMDKFNQYKLATQYKIKMAKSLEIDLEKKLDLSEIPFPCILKPVTSALGVKNDIEICQNKEDLNAAIKNLKQKKYKIILLQEFLDYDYECGIKGCIYNGKAIVPAITKIIRSYPKKRGTNSFGLIEAYDYKNEEINKFINMLEDIKYNGLFDSELFIKKDEIYLNEINCRTSGCGYSLTYGGVNLPYLWVLLVNKKDISKEMTTIKNKYYFQDEVLDLKLLLHKQMSIKEYIKSFNKASVHLILNKNDIKSLIYKFLYAIMKRIDRRSL